MNNTKKEAEAAKEAKERSNDRFPRRLSSIAISP
jgi:hypothetical protein